MKWMEIAGDSKSSVWFKIPDKLENVSVENPILFAICVDALIQNYFKLMRSLQSLHTSTDNKTTLGWSK